MLLLADFLVDSDLCLPSDAKPLTLRGPDDVFKVIISNAGTAASPPPEGVLSMQLVFDQPGLDENSRDKAIELLFPALNVLTYATNRKFKVRFLKRIVEWTPGLKERQAIVFHETLEWDEAEPALTSEYIDSAERFLSMSWGDEQHRAMRWYRLGVQAENTDEQFSYFWFALEIVSQATKSVDKVVSQCPKCHGPLFCEKCEEHPKHRPFPREAIRQTILRVDPKSGEEIFRVLELIRHTLMHGGRITSIADQLPCTEEQAVNKLAWVTWNAIGYMFTRPDPRPDDVLHLGHPGNIVRRVLIASFHVQVGYPGDPNDPKISDFPHFDISVTKAPLQKPDGGNTAPT